MKRLGETAPQVAERIRSLADGLADQTDAASVRSYADWLERRAGREQVFDEDELPLGY